ncbi:GNAT family N-acetyltransferase [Seonamhaeicola sp. MEBiC1930]|uniref:GNAT family N-acetyltransferase n=1 Tax=Seonamhaeicola sp. MEBiC01930 TaxID=2976768 RepID=UPI0032479D9A
MSYIIENHKDYKRKTFLIYDVPSYFGIANGINNRLKKLSATQYPGFLTNLDGFGGFDEFLSSNFSKKSRYKFKSYKRTLERSFDVKYKHIFNSISKEEYNEIFDDFNKILTKRFNNKQVTNNNLSSEEWDFYRDVTYQLMLENKASLYIIYNGTSPIAISLNYFSEDILFFAITTFDIDYYKFNLGTVHLMELYKWCFNNNIRTFDLSKGYYDYKERWGNMKYSFENHIYFDSQSMTATTIAYSLFYYFQLKQYLRNKKFNDHLNKIKYFVKKRDKIENSNTYTSEEIIEDNLSSFEEINFNQPEYSYLKKIVFEFVYMKSENINDIRVYNDVKSQNSFIIKGSKSSHLISIK